MAEETSTAPAAAPKTEKRELPKLPPLPPQVVVRKASDGKTDVSFDLTTFQIVKGKNFGTRYLCPEITLENWDKAVEWFGKVNLINIVQTYSKRMFWSIWCHNTNTDGSFNMVGFLTEAADFTSAGLKLKEIRDKIDELQAELTKLLDEGNIGTAPDGTPTADLVKLKELGNQIRGYKDMEDKRSRKPETETEDEPAVATK